jgi:hypothetical protein
VIVRSGAALSEANDRQREKKMIHFKLNSDTSFAQLTDGRLDRYGIATVTGRDGRLTATLIFDGTKILVRADQQNNVARLVGETRPMDATANNAITVLRNIIAL